MVKDLKRQFKESSIWSTILIFRHLRTHLRDRRNYFEALDKALAKRKLVVELVYGGIGDVLVYSSLPRLLKQDRNTDFYLSEGSKKIFRNPDTLKLVFELNPYFKGFAPDSESVRLKNYDRNHILLSPRQASLRTFEKQLGLKGEGLPEIFYVPKPLSEFDNILLVDTNTISGSNLGWVMDEQLTQTIINKFQGEGLKPQYIEPGAQSLFEYVDMINSAAAFICYLSGGHALAVALRKPVTVVLPENFGGGGIFKFIYPNSTATYVRRRSLRRYLK